MAKKIVDLTRTSVERFADDLRELKREPKGGIIPPLSRRFIGVGSPVKIAKAMPDEGDIWPNLEQWLDEKRTVWRFSLGTAGYNGDIGDLPVAMTWQHKEWIEVFNTRVEYVRPNSYHLIWKQDKKWFCYATMLDAHYETIWGALGSPLGTNGTSSIGFASQDIPITDGFGIAPTATNLSSGIHVVCQWNGTNYCLVNYHGCATVIPEDEEDEEE